MTELNSNSAFDDPLVESNPLNPIIADRSKRHHPETAFQKYCSENPSALECRIYED